MEANNKILSFCLALLTAVFSGCADDGYEYDDYHCNLTIDNSMHLDNTLAASMSPMVPGIFCKINHRLLNIFK